MGQFTSDPVSPTDRCPVCGGPDGGATCDRCGHGVSFSWRRDGDVDVLTLTDDILVPDVIKRINDTFGKRPGTWLTIDFRNVRFAPSATLSKLITLHKGVAAGGGRLRLSGMREDMLRVFQITRLDDLLEIV